MASHNSDEEYITIIPELTDRISESLYAERTSQFIGDLKTVIGILRELGAKRLETEAEYLLRSASRGEIHICRGELPPFVTELLTLSIDMQMAKSRAARGIEQRLGELESMTDIVGNLSVAERLIRDGESGRAYEIILNMRSPEGNPAFAGLIEAAARREHERTGGLIRELKEYYEKRIAGFSCKGSGDPRLILAVDDRPEILNTVSQALKGHYKVLGAPGGEIALKVLQRNKPDLFILDIEMPVMNGLQLAEMIRRMEGHAQTPVIFLTSNATKEYVQKAMAEGADDFIVKPANNNTLLARVSKYLS